MKGIGNFTDDFFKIKSDKDLIIESVTRILTTDVGECYGLPSFGCQLKRYLFSFKNVLLEDIEWVISSAINKWEPRVNIIYIDVENDDEESVELGITLQIKSTLERFYIDIPISI